MERESREVVLQPFQMEILPIRTLLLFNFEKAPDEIYRSLELQYLVTEKVEGYRMIAYRNDDYVDIYDEVIFEMEGDCKVCGKGMKHFRKVSFSNPYFELTSTGIRAGFGFEDYKGRQIEVRLEEHSRRKTKPFDMIAPVGLSSEKPTSFPAFAMYDFDFARRRHTEVSIVIDGKTMKPDLFPVPVPKDGQMRSFIRYGMDCELVEFGKTKQTVLTPVPCKENLLEQGNLVTEVKENEGEYQIHVLRFAQSKHRFEVIFEDGFPDLLRMEDGVKTGAYSIQMEESIGFIGGRFQVRKKQDIVHIELNFAEGWVRKNKEVFEKLLFNKKSVFATWPKTYHYKQEINLSTGKTKAKWERK